MLIADSISKRYGNVEALSNVSLRLEKGVATGLLGKNGAGKSTLMNILTGYIGASDGSVTLGGVSLSDSPEEYKRHIGYLPETPPLYPDMTVREQLTFAASIKGLGRRNRSEAIDRALIRADALTHSGRLIRHLSKGYRQRVGLAQALLGEPDVLILDEPSAGLDPAQIAQLRQAVGDYAKEHAVLVSSHILSEISDICESIVVLNAGRVIASGSTDKLIMLGGARQWLRYRGDEALLEAIKGIDGVRSVEVKGIGEDGCVDVIITEEDGADTRGSVARIVSEGGAELLMLRPAREALEDAFLTLTGSEALS